MLIHSPYPFLDPPEEAEPKRNDLDPWELADEAYEEIQLSRNDINNQTYDKG